LSSTNPTVGTRADGEAPQGDAKPGLKKRFREALYPAAPTRDFWFALIGVALLARVIVAGLLLHDMPLFSDASAHSIQATEIVDGVNHFPYYFPVGTSYVLAAGYWVFGVHLWVAHALMILISVGSVVTTALLARRLVKDPRAAILAGWALALYPGMWMQAAQPFSFDIPLLCVNLAALFALRGWEKGHLYDYAIVGVALGFAAVTRPSTLSIALALIVAALVVIWRRRNEGAPTRAGRFALGTAVAAVFAVATMTPAVVHNEHYHQGLTLSVNNELNTWLGNNPYTPSYRTNYLGQHQLKEFGPETAAYMRRFIYGRYPSRERRQEVRDETERYVKAHPAETAFRSFNRIREFWGYDYTISNLFRVEWAKGAKAEAFGLIFEAGGYFVLALLTFIALIFARQLFRPGAIWLLIGLILTFQIPYVLVYAGGRWHYPVLGLLAIFAGVGLKWLIDTPDRWKLIWRSRAFWIATVIFALIQIEYSYFLFIWNYNG
jgi:4-amino-4-deoxy-L-arabinose transferase-like glycosyltransferase